MLSRSNDAGLVPVPALDDRQDKDRDDEADGGYPPLLDPTRCARPILRPRIAASISSTANSQP